MAFSKYCSDLKYGHMLVSWFFYRKILKEKVKCNLHLLNFNLTNGKGIVLVRLELEDFCLFFFYFHSKPVLIPTSDGFGNHVM